VSRSSLPVPPPLEGNDELIAAVITAGWVVTLIILLIVRDQLAPGDRWWVWVAVVGCCLGVFGMLYVPWLKRSRDRAAARQAARGAAGPD
jgi:H+/Cl- antiporter ClcA